jgi:multidrug resistance protein MdtO
MAAHRRGAARHLLALLLIVFVQPWTDSLSGLLAMSLPVLALAAWIAAGSERIAYAGIQIGFTFALAFLSWFAPLTNLTELGSGAGHPARGAGLLHCSFVSLAGQRSAAAEIPPCGTLSPAGGLPRRPEGGGPLAPVCRLHRQRSADPPGSRRTAGHVCHPWPQAKNWPMRATLAQAEEIARLSEGYRLNAAPGDPTLPAAPNSCGATPNVSNRRRRRLANSWPPT